MEGHEVMDAGVYVSYAKFNPQTNSEDTAVVFDDYDSTKCYVLKGDFRKECEKIGLDKVKLMEFVETNKDKIASDSPDKL